MFTPEEAPRVLSDDQLDAIHDQAMVILEEIGMNILWEPIRDLLAAQGNQVDGERVRFDRAWIMEMVAKAPEVFELGARNPDRNITIGNGSLILLPVGGSPFASDMERGRRAGTVADHDELTKLAQAADAMECLQGGTVEPQDVDVDFRHLATDYSMIRWSDKPYVAYGGAGFRGRDSLEMARIAYGGTLPTDKPSLMTVVNPVSPLVWDERMCDLLVVTAEAGQGLVVTPFLLAGGTAPVSLSGALSIQVAEALSGTAIAQMITPGLPCMFGSFFTPLDMRTGAPAFGLPEGVLATLAGGQFSRRYRLPYRGGGGLCSGNQVDAQSASESANSLWATFLASSDLVLHAAGWLEGGLTASYEKFALDVEVCAQFKRTAAGIGTSQDEMALDAIRELGPGGLFLASSHTMEHFREWLYMSPLFTTPDFTTWNARGRESLEDRAIGAWHHLMDQYEDPGLDDAIDEELKEFMARRTEEIAAGIGVSDD